MTTQADPPDRRSDPPHNHDHHTPTADNGGRLLQQTLMSHPECYVYRVPPCSTTSQGYRAQEWNLGQPLQECGTFMLRSVGAEASCDWWVQYCKL